MILVKQLFFKYLFLFFKKNNMRLTLTLEFQSHFFLEFLTQSMLKKNLNMCDLILVSLSSFFVEHDLGKIF